MNKPKILLVTNVIAPYRIPVFNCLARHNDISIMFVFLQDMLKNLKLKVLWKEIEFNYEVLAGKEILFPGREITLHLNRGFLRLLLKEDPDVIVSLGYTYIESIIALAYSRLRNKRFVLWSGSTLQSSRSKNPVIRKIKKMIINNCDTFLAYGNDAADYLVHYGADRSKIAISCNTVDVEKFHLKSKEHYINKGSIKRDHDLPRLNILFCGQLIPRKNLLTLINAFRSMDTEDIGLIVLGDGYERDQYKAYCTNIKNVFFRGHQDFEELIKYYAVSDVFVMPSLTEVWGLVVNEAMACGLPVICSNRSGVAVDLVKAGVNGYTFDPEDVTDLKNKLITLLNDDNKRNDMGRKSVEMIKNRTPENYAEDLLKAIELANHS